MIDLENAVEFENRWDGRLGGFETRPYREFMAYAAGRLMRAGATDTDVIDYLRELVTEFFDDGKTQASA